MYIYNQSLSVVPYAARREGDLPEGTKIVIEEGVSIMYFPSALNPRPEDKYAFKGLGPQSDISHLLE